MTHDPPPPPPERVSEREDVRQALAEATKTAPPIAVPPPAERVRLGSWLGLAAALVVLRLSLRTGAFAFAVGRLELLERVVTGALLAAIVLAAGKAIELYVLARVGDSVARFDLRRVVRLLVGIVVTFLVLSVLFVNWYTAAVSLGLLSLILGFALQTPITSFIGWIYLLVKRPYRVGDRIRIGDATGDVIDIAYLDTTLWEFGGQYLSSDHPSGRVIRFPNSTVLTEVVWNYSWPLFPWIWNELRLHISYEADLDRVAAVMQEVAEEELGSGMMAQVRVYRELLARTPVDHLEVNERPAVYFRVSDNTWLEAIVRYLVEPKRAGRVRSNLLRKLLERLAARDPGQTTFPKANLR